MSITLFGCGTATEYYPSYQEHTMYSDESHRPFSTGLDEPVDLTTRLVGGIPDAFGESIREWCPRQPKEESGAQDPFRRRVHAACRTESSSSLAAPSGPEQRSTHEQSPVRTFVVGGRDIDERRERFHLVE